MSFIISIVCIYSLSGERREIEFHGPGLNVLTGSAKTGKSSIVDILDYCFGRSECNVAEGVIRRYVSWFGVEIGNGSDILFIARRNPGVGVRTSPDIYIRRGRHERLPNHSELLKNITEDALINFLTRFVGIAENENRPINETRPPLHANIRHALLLCFQRQDEIASRDRLFHRQGEPFVALAIRDTLPYFLGAVDEKHFIIQYRLDEARKRLRELETRKEALARNTNESLGRLRRIILDARRVGLLSEDFESHDIEHVLAELRRVATIDVRSPTTLPIDSNVIVDVESELQTLRYQLQEVQNDIRATRLFIRERTEYSQEVSEQRARLISLELYTGESGTDHICPVCETHLSNLSPSAEDLLTSLRSIEHQLGVVESEEPHLLQRLDALEKRRNMILESIVTTQRNLERLYADDERTRILRDHVIERARVVGRIGAFLDHSAMSDESDDLDRRIANAKRDVEVLERLVDTDEKDERVNTFLNLVATYMTEYAGSLELEHSEQKARIDPKRLTVVADTLDGPIPLSRIGSGENWVGYHVVALLALHRWFRGQKRPVPGMMILDQPSQAHYPPEADQDGSTDVLQDADRRAVRALFRLMFEVGRDLGRGFQLIVLDHAHIDEEWFEGAIVEEWRDGMALVPAGWIDE